MSTFGTWASHPMKRGYTRNQTCQKIADSHPFVHLLLATMASLTYDQLMAVSDQGFERRRQRHAAAWHPVAATPNYYDVMKMVEARKAKREWLPSGQPQAASTPSTAIVIEPSPLTKEDRIANVLLEHGAARDLLSAHCKASEMMRDHPDVDGFLDAYE